METKITTQIQITPLLVSTENVAVALGISRRKLDSMDSSGALGPMPVRCFGRRKLWKLSEIQAWVESDCPPRDAWLKLKEQK